MYGTMNIKKNEVNSRFSQSCESAQNLKNTRLVGPTQLIFVAVTTHRTESTLRWLGCSISLLSQHSKLLAKKCVIQ